MFNFMRESKGKKFWDWFVKNSDKYESIFSGSSNTAQLFEELHKELQKFNPNLTFEFNKNTGKKINELIISADGIKKNFPAVLELVKEAPNLSSWKFTAFRPRKGGNTVKIDNIEIDPATVFFKHIWQGELIDLRLFVKNYVDNDAYNKGVFILLDDILGEYDVATKIGIIKINKLEDSEDAQPIRELPGIVDANR